VFENRVLRRAFGPKRDEVTGEWRKLHNEELNDLYCSPNVVRVIRSRRLRWAEHVTRIPIRATCPAHLILLNSDVALKPEGKRSLGRTRRRWKGNIKLDIQELGCGGISLVRSGSR